MSIGRHIVLIIISSFGFALAACGPAFNPAIVSFADQISKQVGCKSLKADLWNEIYQVAYSDSDFPTADELEEHLNQKLSDRWNASQTDSNDSRQRNLKYISHRVAQIYKKIIDETKGQNNQNVRETIKTLARLELGDHSTPERAALQKLINDQLPEVVSTANSAGLDCSPPPTSTPDPGQNKPDPASEGELLDTWNRDQDKLVYGAWKSMAVAYQSCEAVDLAPLDERTPDAEGVSVIKTNPQNGGKWREITNLDKFIKTNPYYHAYREPDVSCNDIRKKLLIYDYGGKPNHNTQLPYVIDLFSQNGTGSTELGIDCSGLVLTAYFTSGLRLSTSAPNRPMLFDAIPARHFKDPQGYSSEFPLDCISYVSMKPNESIRPGDVLASSGHIVIVDGVGPDPFGVSHITKKTDCKLANIDPARFNFSIVHSSPEKGALGISRLTAASYFKDGTMTEALESYAVAACKAQFGESSTPKPAGASLVRHNGQAECMDRTMSLKNTSCLKSCRAPAAQTLF